MSFKFTKRNELIALIILFLIAFILRLMTFNSIFVGNNVRFLEFDPFYHMRRALSFAQYFPRIWNFDTYIDYPYGSNVGWPPLYDWTIALIANIIGLGHPNRHLVETVGVFFPAILGSLSVVVIYFLCKELFDDSNNIVHKQKDNKQNNKQKDHKQKDYKQKDNKQKDNKQKDNKQKDNKQIGFKIGFVSGVLLAIIPAFVQVSFLGFVDHHVAEVLLSSTIFLFIIRALKAKERRKKITFISISGLVLILAILTWPGTPIFIGIILIFIIIQTIIEKKYKYLSVIIGIIIIFTIILYLKFPEIYGNLIGGINFLTREGPVVQQIVETQPLFFTFQGRFTLEPSWFAFNTSLYIGLLGMILYLRNMIKGGMIKSGLKDRVKIFFLVWTFIVLLLNLYQTRFIYLFAVNIVILCSYAIIELFDSDKEYLKIISLILLAVIIVPSIQTVDTMVNHPLMWSNDWFNSLEWLKDNTPNPGNWDNPIKDDVPAYGVMEWWDYGNYILYLSQRPVVANNFQLGIEDSTKFFSSENVTDANNIMNKRKARYVIVDYRLGLNPYISGNQAYIRGAWVSVAILLNKDLSYYLDKNNFPNERYLNTMYSRLYLFDGKGLNNYKLIYKSPTKYQSIFDKPIEEVKIFEYTPG